MNVLLLHPADGVPPPIPGCSFDLIVDFARAPASTYDRWASQAGCSIISLFDFAAEFDDLRQCRRLLQLGGGHLVDGQGIDWWDIVGLELVPQLQRLMLVDRLAGRIESSNRLFASRPFWLFPALARRLKTQVEVLASPLQLAGRRFREYIMTWSRLDRSQLAQVVADKFDPYHRVRRLAQRKKTSLGGPVILLPTAYENVSRTAASYAAQVADREFLLVYARSRARLPVLPANVHAVSLDAYFHRADGHESNCLEGRWRTLRPELVNAAAEFCQADFAGILDGIPSRLRWALNLASAWTEVFDSEDIAGCLCADDTNPYTRVPLLLARKRGISNLVCHHGSLDSWMMIKQHEADHYLAKNEMERDYLVRVCGVSGDQVGSMPLSPVRSNSPQRSRMRPSSLVFFTEPYANAFWRSDDIYRDLLPGLHSVARECGLKLAFKLHPFDSVKGFGRILRRYLSAHTGEIEIIGGPSSEKFWENIRVAVTVQSSTALECAARGIPVFLCAWLRDPYSGYVRQFARFDVGRVLQSPEELGQIRQRLEGRVTDRQVPDEKKKSEQFEAAVAGDSRSVARHA